MTTRSSIVVIFAFWLLFGALLAGGCGEDSELPEYDQISGKVTRIEKTSGEVSMSYFSEKHRKPVEIHGRLSPEAEIFIDGVTASLDDVRIGDRVKVLGRVEKREGERNLVALKVEIDRREPATSSAPG
ncbi:MAG TPA: hypothetical protein PLL20_02985 [Phycisphaerae bacterium]|nr:hypothetical protein [Phycisphaerae bacterium]HRR84569.1 hypothetical protein [Phycisphaerae bacterium]